MSPQRETDRSDLSAFLDGQLSPDKAEQMAEALQNDLELRAELESLEATRRLLANLPVEPAPEELHESIMEHLERQRLLRSPGTPQRARPLRWIRHMATAAIIVLTVGLGFYLHNVLSGGSWVDRVEEDGVGGPELVRHVGGPPREIREPKPNATAGVEKASGGEVEGSADRVVAKDSGRLVAIGTPDKRGVSNRSEFMLRSLPRPLAPPSAEVAIARDEEGAPAITGAPWRPDFDGRYVDDMETPASSGPAMAARQPKGDIPLGYEQQRENVPASWVYGQMGVAVRTVTLKTTDLIRTNRRVGEVLANNDVLPQTSDLYAQISESQLVVASRSNSFYNVQTAPDSNQVVFYVTEAQAPEIVAQLQAIDTPAAAAAMPRRVSGPRSEPSRAKGGTRGEMAIDDMISEHRDANDAAADSMGGGGMGMGMRGPRGGVDPGSEPQYGGGMGGMGMSEGGRPATVPAGVRVPTLGDAPMMQTPGRGGGAAYGASQPATTQTADELFVFDGVTWMENRSELAKLAEEAERGGGDEEPPMLSQVARQARPDDRRARRVMDHDLGRLVQVIVTIVGTPPHPATRPVAPTQPATAPTTQPAPSPGR